MKKILIFMLFLEILGVAPRMTVEGAMAAIIASGDDCGDDCHWQISDDGILTISGTGAIKGYSRYDADNYAPWRVSALSSKVNSLVIEKGIDAIGSHTFDGMRTIENVSLPDGLKTIGVDAFNSTSLTSVHLPETLETIAMWAFSNASISEINLPESLTEIKPGTFQNTKLTTLAIPENVKSLSITAFETGNGYQNIPLTTLYCPEHLMEQCEKAVAFRSGEATVMGYTKQGQRYSANGKFYKTLADMQNGIIFTPKRIYTVDEAAKASKKTGNTFRIRYK